ncbi:MAG: hypothetical protein ACK5Y2_06225 [Bdellovibrionales bacterium]
MKSISRVILAISVSFYVLSCDQGQEGESDIAKAITLRVTQDALVLPTDLDEFETCIDGGADGPRVRIRASLVWNGTGKGSDENLVPLTVSLIIENNSQVGSYVRTLSTGGTRESISIIFGYESTDYIAPGATAATPRCFLDYGGLPAPAQEITGTRQVFVNGTIRVMGIVRQGDREEPFVKDVRTRILYVAGSIPIAD